ncbi:DNA mismatch repair protein MSH2 [Selaginella moellendorffii]|nr:DNA mismatch repair protein MSH2 [Selaginella moellendorffii]|eukprot:XP_002982304.2 DNA mismatch repair protein MSH2 [Selaginella moellendorffii]
MAMEAMEDDPKLPELKLDAKQAQGFIKFFRKLPEDPSVIRFFDRRDYFTAHGDNASLIARLYYRTTTALRQVGSGSDTLSSVSISKSMFEVITRDVLLEKTEYNVELYEGSGGNWKLAKSATPGKLGSFEDVLFSSIDMHDTPVVMAVWTVARDQEQLVGIAFTDMTRRTLGTLEFLDDDQYTNLESALLALGCRECVLPAENAKSVDGRRLRDVLARCNVRLTEKKKAEFKSRDIEQDLSRLIKSTSVEELRELVVKYEVASAALAALLAYTDIFADDSNHGKYRLQQYSLDRYMRLDAAALRALHVLESKNDPNKNSTLFGLMNRTSTAGMGKRLLNRWLKQPLLDVDEIKHRHDVVQMFVEDAELRESLKNCLKRVPDVERLTRKLERSRATLQDLVKLYQVSVRLSVVKDALERYEGEFASAIEERYVVPLREWTLAEHLGRYDALIESAIDLDQIKNGEYIISASYDSSLKTIKADRDAVEEEIREAHEQAANDLDLPADKSLKLDKTTQWGHVFRITKKEEPKVRKKLAVQYITLETRKDGIKFTTSKLRRLSERYGNLTENYTNTQRDLVKRLVQVSQSYVEIFNGAANLLAELDVLLSFADLAVSSPTPYVRPIITGQNEGDIILEGSRHPCVEAQDDVNFIPNDCRLIRGKSWFQIITGPNMGGKSTYIRQIGVNILMAQVGCFVPCYRAEISIRSCIFARVGAGDCQLRGVSTFMAEMLETSAILKSATETSLIIVDELGRGTSTYDGFGLAWAICEYIVDVTRAPTLFATHFHELTSISHRQGPSAHGPSKGPPVGISNFHVSAHIDPSSRKLTMLYKVEDGPCDQSFGIHVAEFARFPECVVALAKQKAAELEDFSPQAILEDEGDAGSKRKRSSSSSSSSGDKGWKFLKGFAAMPLDQMSHEHALKKVQELKAEFLDDLPVNTLEAVA